MFFSWIQRDGPWVLLFFLFFASILCPSLMLLIFPVHLPVKQHVEFSFHCSSIKDTETPDMSVTKSKDQKWGKLKTTRMISVNGKTKLDTKLTRGNKKTCHRSLTCFSWSKNSRLSRYFPFTPKTRSWRERRDTGAGSQLMFVAVVTLTVWSKSSRTELNGQTQTNVTSWKCVLLYVWTHI